ncbi:phosphotransferase family protein [Brevibacillus brevis]|uniref:phosphotransferase family protein n=1 Tax=Brevibacillus brevis TaxID=1393 RepID=UPI0025A5C661|nr:aminoglycoside phosphotransferase family protein [Brevibacillus brevis]WJQ84504.1 aminoglycoside phosphotransferase family protein [Brevibacillus brevis]
MTTTTQTYIQHIQAMYPKLTITSAYFNEMGQNNDVLIVNDAYVFRFPKYSSGIEQLKVETSILRTVKPYLSLPIPAPIYLSFAEETPGRVFAGYPLLEGEPFTREAFQAASRQNSVPTVAAQLAQFLHELHQLPVSSLLPELIPGDFDMAKQLTELYEQIASKLFPAMREQAKKDVAERFEAYLANPAHFDFQPCLTHGDFGTGNILYSPTKQRITGIIDFGGSGVGDPAYDLAGLCASYGEAFLQYFTPVYIQLEQVLTRMRFYRSTFALEEALFGLENNDEAAYQAGMRNYL